MAQELGAHTVLTEDLSLVPISQLPITQSPGDPRAPVSNAYTTPTCTIKLYVTSRSSWHGVNWQHLRKVLYVFLKGKKQKQVRKSHSEISEWSL